METMVESTPCLLQVQRKTQEMTMKGQVHSSYAAEIEVESDNEKSTSARSGDWKHQIGLMRRLKRAFDTADVVSNPHLILTSSSPHPRFVLTSSSPHPRFILTSSSPHPLPILTHPRFILVVLNSLPHPQNPHLILTKP